MHAQAEPYGFWEILKLRLEHVGRLGPMNYAKYDWVHSAYVPQKNAQAFCAWLE